MNSSIKDGNLLLLETCFLTNIKPNKTTYKLLIEHNLFNNILEIGFIKSDEIDFTSIIIDFIQEDKESFAYYLILNFHDMTENIQRNNQLIIEEALSWGRLDIIGFYLSKPDINFDYNLSKITNSKTLKYLRITMI